jgi:hypothetical protein
LDEDEIKLMHRDHAWFVAYAPAENPSIAVSVIVEHGEHGSTAAAPIAKEVIAAHLNIGEQEAAAAGGRTGARPSPPPAGAAQREVASQTPDTGVAAPTGEETNTQ